MFYLKYQNKILKNNLLYIQNSILFELSKIIFHFSYINFHILGMHLKRCKVYLYLTESWNLLIK